MILRVDVRLQRLQAQDATLGLNVWAQRTVLLPRGPVSAFPVVAVAQVRVRLFRLGFGVRWRLAALDKGELHVVRSGVREPDFGVSCLFSGRVFKS